MESPWEVLEPSLPLLTAPYAGGRVRMVALGLRDGGLVVWSPGTRGDAARAALAQWGTVRFLLAPNHFHNAGLDEWKRAYPEARVVAHPRAQERLRKKITSARDIDGLDALTVALPDGARLLSPPMARQGETFLAVQRGEMRALAACDAIVNMRAVPLFFRVLGFRPRLMTNPFFRRVFLADAMAYRAWMIAELTAAPPNVFIPSHGDVLRGDHVAGELRRITEAF